MCVCGHKCYLAEEQFERSDVVIRQTKALLVLTHHIHLKTGLGLLLQVTHASYDVLFDADKLIMAALLEIIIKKKKRG